MRLPTIFRTSSSKEKAPPVPERTRPRDLPLDFWYIERRDRKRLVTRIMPYMADELPKQDSVHAILKRYPWLKAFIASEHAPATSATNGATFDGPRKEFYEASRKTIEILLDLTHVWFFTLIRYTYRVRFLEGSTVSKSPLVIEDLRPDPDTAFGSDFTEDDIYTLTELRKYGTSLYRSMFKRAVKRPAWQNYCARIVQFCTLLDLDSPSRDPEIALQDLGHHWSSGLLHRKIRYKEDELLAPSSALHAFLEVPSLTATEISSHSTASQLDDEKEEHYDPPPDARAMNARAMTTDQIIESIRNEDHGQLDEIKDRLCRMINREQLYMDIESILACRWLLEHLPPKSRYGEGGFAWKKYWQKEWEKCLKNNLPGHPLSKLVKYEKYNKIGARLYNILSNRIHQYGNQRAARFELDVEEVMAATKPLFYRDDGSIDLKKERQRWMA